MIKILQNIAQTMNLFCEIRKKITSKTKQGQRSQKLTPRESKGNKTGGFKVKTSTKKLKSQYGSSAKQSKN